MVAGVVSQVAATPHFEPQVLHRTLDLYSLARQQTRENPKTVGRDTLRSGAGDREQLAAQEIRQHQVEARAGERFDRTREDAESLAQ